MARADGIARRCAGNAGQVCSLATVRSWADVASDTMATGLRTVAMVDGDIRWRETSIRYVPPETWAKSCFMAYAPGRSRLARRFAATVSMVPVDQGFIVPLGLAEAVAGRCEDRADEVGDGEAHGDNSLLVCRHHTNISRQVNEYLTTYP